MPNWNSSQRRDDLKECPFCDSVPHLQQHDNRFRVSCVDPTCEVICHTKDCESEGEAKSIWQFRPIELREAAEREMDFDD